MATKAKGGKKLGQAASAFGGGVAGGGVTMALDKVEKLEDKPWVAPLATLGLGIALVFAKDDNLNAAGYGMLGATGQNTGEMVFTKKEDDDEEMQGRRRRRRGKFSGGFRSKLKGRKHLSKAMDKKRRKFSLKGKAKGGFNQARFIQHLKGMPQRTDAAISKRVGPSKGGPVAERMTLIQQDGVSSLDQDFKEYERLLATGCGSYDGMS